MSHRYAIYVTPDPDTALARFGATWLGWDSATGQSVPHPEAPGLDIARMTETPRKYGFHGTIKPPLFLAEGKTPEAYEDALHGLSASLAPVTLDGLQLARLGRFLALTPMGDSTALAALAARVVQELDAFRAPPSDAELARRNPARLTDAQRVNLDHWGYPYVLNEFRYHMTLTGRLDDPTAEAALDWLTPQIDALALRPYRIDALTLLRSDDEGRFHQIVRAPLTG